MMVDFEVQDEAGQQVKVGTHVRADEKDFVDGQAMTGVVTQITEPDVDADDDGRTIVIGPEIIIRFDDQDEDDEQDQYPTSFLESDPDGDNPTFLMNDLDVITQVEEVAPSGDGS